jgi:hypothetical protein
VRAIFKDPRRCCKNLDLAPAERRQPTVFAAGTGFDYLARFPTAPCLHGSVRPHIRSMMMKSSVSNHEAISVEFDRGELNSREARTVRDAFEFREGISISRRGSSQHHQAKRSRSRRARCGRDLERIPRSLRRLRDSARHVLCASISCMLACRNRAGGS